MVLDIIDVLDWSRLAPETVHAEAGEEQHTLSFISFLLVIGFHMRPKSSTTLGTPHPAVEWIVVPEVTPDIAVPDKTCFCTHVRKEMRRTVEQTSFICALWRTANVCCCDPGSRTDCNGLGKFTAK